jgi:hypothetical protein
MKAKFPSPGGLILIIVLVSGAVAQPHRQGTICKAAFAVEFTKPNYALRFSDNSSNTIFISFWDRLSEKTVFVIETPYAQAGYSTNYYNNIEQKDALGDIYAGFKIGGTRPGLQFSFPLTRDLSGNIDYVLSLNFMTGFE